MGQWFGTRLLLWCEEAAQPFGKPVVDGGDGLVVRLRERLDPVRSIERFGTFKLTHAALLGYFEGVGNFFT